MKSDYSRYVNNEVATNRRKFDVISLSQAEVWAIAKAWHSRHGERGNTQVPAETFALCQGIRNGSEMRAFSWALRRRVIGTDISPTVLQVPDGILCDFHECPRLWSDRVCFLYSNAWDHSYDLDLLLEHWRGLMCNGGMIFLQYTPNSGSDAAIDLTGLVAKVSSRFRDVQEVEITNPPQLVAICWWMFRRLRLCMQPFPPLPGPWPGPKTMLIWGVK